MRNAEIHLQPLGIPGGSRIPPTAHGSMRNAETHLQPLRIHGGPRDPPTACGGGAHARAPTPVTIDKHCSSEFYTDHTLEIAIRMDCVILVLLLIKVRKDEEVVSITEEMQSVLSTDYYRNSTDNFGSFGHPCMNTQCGWLLSGKESMCWGGLGKEQGQI